MIVGHGYSSAKVMLIADGCTQEDTVSGRCISGYNESMISKLLSPNGLNINEMWRTALIKEKINLNVPELNVEMVTPTYKNILVNEINEIRPNVIVPLCELSFQFLTGLKSINKFRGSVLPSSDNLLAQPTRIIPVLGPNPYLEADYSMRFISRLDFAKVAKNKHLTEPIREIGNVWIAKDSSMLREYFKRQYSKAKFMVFDIETFAGVPTCISICFDGLESVTVPIIDSKISLDNRVLMFKEVAKLLNSPIPKVNQNIKFDWKKCERFLLKVNNIVGDTLIAASVLFPEFPKNLGFLTSLYTDMPYFKDEGKQYDPSEVLFPEFPKNLGFLTSLYTDMPYFKDEGKQYDPSVHNRDRLYLYCAKDSLATHQIYSQQLEEMKELKVDGVYNQLMAIFPLYKKMEDNGIRIDFEARERLRAKYETLYNIQVLKFQMLVNNNKINPASPLQVRKLIYEEMKFKAVAGIKRTTKGLLGTDEESLELLMWMSKYDSVMDGHEILRTLIAIRKIHKIIEYLATLLHPDGRMRCEYNLAGAVTGRTTAGKTTDGLLIAEGKGFVLRDIGRSFQTIAKHGFELNGEELGKELRSMFIPSEGYSFVECDLSQAEARVDAILAKDFDILPVFDGPIGIHRLTGSWIYGCKPEEIKKNILVDGVDRYHQAKTGRHAAERNMGDKRLMMMIHQPMRECQRILQKIHQEQPNLRGVFHHEVEYYVRTTRRLVAPNGRVRNFYGREGKDQTNEAISYLPQVIVSDQLKFSLPKTFLNCGSFARPLLEAHDGFLAEVLIGREEEYAREFKRNVETGIDFRGCTLNRDYELIIPMECETSSTNWQELKPFKF